MLSLLLLAINLSLLIHAQECGGHGSKVDGDEICTCKDGYFGKDCAHKDGCYGHLKDCPLDEQESCYQTPYQCDDPVPVTYMGGDSSKNWTPRAKKCGYIVGFKPLEGGFDSDFAMNEFWLQIGPKGGTKWSCDTAKEHVPGGDTKYCVIKLQRCDQDSGEWAKCEISSWRNCAKRHDKFQSMIDKDLAFYEIKNLKSKVSGSFKFAGGAAYKRCSTYNTKEHYTSSLYYKCNPEAEAQAKKLGYKVTLDGNKGMSNRPDTKCPKPKLPSAPVLVGQAISDVETWVSPITVFYALMIAAVAVMFARYFFNKGDEVNFYTSLITKEEPEFVEDEF